MPGTQPEREVDVGFGGHAVRESASGLGVDGFQDSRGDLRAGQTGVERFGCPELRGDRAPATGAAASLAPPPTAPAASVVVPTLTATTPLIDVLPAEIGGEAMQKNALSGSDLSALDASAAMVFGRSVRR